MVFLSKFLLFSNLKCRSLLLSCNLILIKVSPLSCKNLEISSNSLSDLISNVTSLIGLFNKSLRDPIFWTLVLLNLFSSLEIDLTRVKIKELPSFSISRFKSRISEKINNSKTLVRSVNFNTA